MSGQKEPKITRVFISDFRQKDKRKNIKKEFREFKEYFLTDEQKERLAKKTKVGRFFFYIVWLLKSMFLKLTPIRRLLIIIGLILSMNTTLNFTSGDQSVSTQNRIIGPLFIIFVLGLELKDKLKAKDELTEGRAVQLSMIPESTPQIDGWDIWLYSEPANDVGGDFVDYQDLGKKIHRFALGDISGKGLPAALYMVKLQATLRALAPEFDSLSALLKKINSIFFRDGSVNKFASFFYLELQNKIKKVRYVNAGHIPPFLIRNKVVSESKKGDLAIGLKDDIRFNENNIDMEQNDLLFIYSDGVTELRNENGDFYGEERLRSFLQNKSYESAEKTGDALLEDLKHFHGEAQAYDDISIIILKKL